MIGAFRWFWERGNQEVGPPAEERRETLGGYPFRRTKRKQHEEKLEAVEEAIEQVIEAAPKKPSRNYVIESLTAIHQRHQFSEIVAAAQYMQAEMQTRKQQTFLRALLEHARLLQEEEEAVTLLLLH
jgi:hypothetical protein